MLSNQFKKIQIHLSYTMGLILAIMDSNEQIF